MSPTDLFKNSGHNNIKLCNGLGGREDCSSNHKYVLTQPLLTTTSRHVFQSGLFLCTHPTSPSLSPSLAGLHLHLHISYNLGFFLSLNFSCTPSPPSSLKARHLFLSLIGNIIFLPHINSPRPFSRAVIQKSYPATSRLLYCRFGWSALPSSAADQILVSETWRLVTSPMPGCFPAICVRSPLQQ